jgi:hypothetical protein
MPLVESRPVIRVLRALAAIGACVYGLVRTQPTASSCPTSSLPRRARRALCGSTAQHVPPRCARSSGTRGGRGRAVGQTRNPMDCFRSRCHPTSCATTCFADIGPDLPPPQRRLSAVCAPGYTGRKRGEVVRTRTTLLAAPILISGSSPLEEPAMEITEASCYGDSLLLLSRLLSMDSHPSLPRLSVCGSLELTVWGGRSLSSTWLLLSRGSVYPFSHHSF